MPRRAGHFRIVLLATVLASAAVLAAAPTASARLIERSHDRGTDTFAEQLCGIDVITTVQFVDNSHARIGPNGFPLFQSTGRATVTWTNPATGLAVVNEVRGTNFKDLSATDNGDGTVTVRTAVTGIPEQIILPDGTVAIKDVGRVVFSTVLDYNGTPADAYDDVFISSSTESISGPHPEYDSGFTLFCPAVVDGLT